MTSARKLQLEEIQHQALVNSLAPDFDVSVQDGGCTLTVAIKASIRHEAIRSASWKNSMELIMMATDIILDC